MQTVKLRDGLCLLARTAGVTGLHQLLFRTPECIPTGHLMPFCRQLCVPSFEPGTILSYSRPFGPDLGIPTFVQDIILLMNPLWHYSIQTCFRSMSLMPERLSGRQAALHPGAHSGRNSRKVVANGLHINTDLSESAWAAGPQCVVMCDRTLVSRAIQLSAI